MTRRTQQLPVRTLAAFLEGEVTRSEAAAIEAQLRDCAASRRELEQLEDLRTTLTRLPAELDGVDLVDSVRRAIAAAPPRDAPRARSLAWRWTARLVAAAAVVVVVVAGLAVWRPGVHTVAERDVRAKSAAPGVVEDRWVGIEAFRVGDDATARPLGDAARIRSGDGLVMRYTNLGREPFGYLMVFAVDAARAVHWYYPAYEVAGSTPMSIEIQRGSSVALADVVRHDLPAGTLVLYGLFTRAPLGVVEVERVVAAVIAHGDWDAGAPPRLAVPGSGQHIVRIDVAR
jgi:uncharacterized membrane protein YphA (DoxX/SURF4 family)